MHSIGKDVHNVVVNRPRFFSGFEAENMYTLFWEYDYPVVNFKYIVSK